MGYERLPYHVVWDCKFDDRRKARVVLQGDKQEATTDESTAIHSTYEIHEGVLSPTSYLTSDRIGVAGDESE